MSRRRIDGPYGVSTIRPHHSWQLAQLFSAALDQDFSYYSRDYLRSTRRQNTVPRLAFGSLRSSRLMVGLWHHNHLVGYIIGATRPQSDRGDIFWLYVEPAHRGKGLGAELVSEAVTWLKEKRLSAVELVTYDHAPFYERQGFVTDHLAKGFIGGKDVYIMKRSLL